MAMDNSKTQSLMDSITESINKLAAMTDDTVKSATFRKWLSTVGQFHNYSFGNQLLIMLQRSSASQVAGFQTWKKLGRHVKKGAKGIAILAPLVRSIKVQSDAGEETSVKSGVYGFRTAYVFDVEDTEGAEIATLGEYRANSGGGEELLPRLEVAAAKLGIMLEYTEIAGGAKGWSAGGKVAVEITLSTTAKCGTLAHEIAHELLHQGKLKTDATKKTREQRELEAEATSYAVLSHFGIEQRSDLYLASWSATAEALTDSLQTIRDAVHIILAAMEPQEQEAQALCA